MLGNGTQKANLKSFGGSFSDDEEDSYSPPPPTLRTMSHDANLEKSSRPSSRESNAEEIVSKSAHSVLQEIIDKASDEGALGSRKACRYLHT